eukprot:scaffold63994_cov16-Prasinocladus_malaysianus.AAC.1
MCHRVRRSCSREWEAAGASGQILEWIRHGVRISFVNGRPPPHFNHGASVDGGSDVYGLEASKVSEARKGLGNRRS